MHCLLVLGRIIFQKISNQSDFMEINKLFQDHSFFSDDPLIPMSLFLDFIFREDKQNFYMKFFGFIFLFATFADVVLIWDMSLNDSPSHHLGFLIVVVLQSQVMEILILSRKNFKDIC